MKQRTSVRAIIRKKDTTLLVRRSSGSERRRGLYELPGGPLGAREQPEDSIRRHLQDRLGIIGSSPQLSSVVVTQDPTNSEASTLTIVYFVGLAGEKIDLSDTYSRYLWADSEKLQHVDLTASTASVLQKAGATVSDTNQVVISDVKNSTDDDKVLIYADGGSRGNPGHSAAGFVVLSTNGDVLYEGGEYLGITTNNQAEYHGVRLGLERAAEMGFRRVDFRLDSMLVVNQMKGVYQIKNRDLWPINERIKDLVSSFDKVTFSHVRREFNKHADSLVNKILDAHKRDHPDTF